MLQVQRGALASTSCADGSSKDGSGKDVSEASGIEDATVKVAWAASVACGMCVQ